MIILSYIYRVELCKETITELSQLCKKWIQEVNTLEFFVDIWIFGKEILHISICVPQSIVIQVNEITLIFQSRCEQNTNLSFVSHNK